MLCLYMRGGCGQPVDQAQVFSTIERMASGLVQVAAHGRLALFDALIAASILCVLPPPPALRPTAVWCRAADCGQFPRSHLVIMKSLAGHLYGVFNSDRCNPDMQMATNETDVATNLQTLNAVGHSVGARTLSFLAMQRHL